MIEVRGKYNEAKIFTNNVETTAMSQIVKEVVKPIYNFKAN